MPEQLSLLLQPDAPATAPAPAPADWRVRVSRRARHLKIQVFPHGGVEIVVPPRTRSCDIETFVAAHREWIAATRAKFLQQRPAESALPETVELRALGIACGIEYRRVETARPAINDAGQTLQVQAPDLSPGTVWPLLRGWLKLRARAHLPRLALRVGAELGLNPRRVQVRLQRTRWGSCSARGTLSLNAALLLRPPEQMHYVLVHELCHLRHMNHSGRFWALVERHVPDYRALDRQLDEAWQTAPNWLIG